MAETLAKQLKQPELLKTEACIHGEWVQALSGATFPVEDPGSQQIIASCADLDAEDVDRAVQSSHEAFQTFRKENPRSRARKLMEWDRLIRAHEDDLARVLTLETGKPLAEAHGELQYALGFTWWFAGEAERIRGSVSVPSTPDRRVLVVKQPIGVCVALVPWNFPIVMILRKVAAALAAGCTIIAKPSPETPLTCLMLAQLALQAGFAPGVFNVVTTSNAHTPALAEALCTHPLVSKVTFTGSTAVGSLVAGHCAKGLKKLTMELGGNCPFLVFADGDQEQALAQLLALKWRHAGQACITANRAYVEAPIYDAFVAKLVAATAQIRVGHGTAAGTTMGPVTTARGLAKTRRLLDDAVAQGATVAGGGRTGADLGLARGFFHEPTVLRDVPATARIASEETFGPVLAVFAFQTEAEAVQQANATSMGLASYAFTKNVDRAWRLLENLEAGMIGMNTGNSSAAESPFGGMKLSGYGKESGKDVAVDEYLVSKTVTFTVADHY